MTSGDLSRFSCAENSFFFSFASRNTINKFQAPLQKKIQRNENNTYDKKEKGSSPLTLPHSLIVPHKGMVEKIMSAL